MNRRIVFLLLQLSVLPGISFAQNSVIQGKPTHATVKMQGWTVHVNLELWENERESTTRMAELLDGQLQRVVKAVPPRVLPLLRRVPLWVNPPFPGAQPGAAYHPSRDWLKENGRDPSMAQGIEFTNVKIFPLENRRMPYVALHELAHAYHDLVLGNDEEKIKAAFEAAKASGGYEKVQRFNGNTTSLDRAYALSNHKEYFAELTEAYFGKNDFFPFNREELKSHDPEGYRVIKEMWGD